MVNSVLIKSQKFEKLQQIQQQQHLFENYRLKWRQRHLFVSLNQHEQSPSLPTIQSEQWLVECLKHSPARLVRLDPNLGEDRINLWAIACLEAKIPVFLSLPSACKMKSSSSLLKLSFRFIDLTAASLLLITLSPVILLIVSLIRLDSPQWSVSQRGKLFRIFKFRIAGGNEGNLYITCSRYCLHKYKPDKVPQLFNVLRGEISLMRPSFCFLSLFIKKQL